MALYEIEKNSSGVPTGNYKYVAGRGRAEYGASTVRTGTVTVTAAANSSGYAQVTFSTPMPDADYVIEIEGHMGDTPVYILNRDNDRPKTANGFYVGMYNPISVEQSTVVSWTAFKLYTDTEYNNILAAMPSDASASNKLMTASGVAGLINTESMSPIAASDVDDFYAKFASAIIAKYPVGSSFFVYVDWAGTNTYLHIGMVANSTAVMFISTTYSRADSNYIVLVASGTVYKQTL